MSDLLPINVESLVFGRVVESARVEFKSSISETNKWGITKSICAFANDLHNVNGGYLVLGIDAPNGEPTMPPVGIGNAEIETAQRMIRTSCIHIEPQYQPLMMPFVLEEKTILVVWVPAGDNRPYRCPDDRNPAEKCYFVRIGAESVKAQGELLRQLQETTARIPFDDRRCQSATITDLSPVLSRRFLVEIGSDLALKQPELTDTEVFDSLRIVLDAGGVRVPRNIGVLFFCSRPDQHFAGAKFEVVQFSDDTGGSVMEERIFTGPLDQLIHEVLNYLDRLTGALIRKIPGRAEVERTVAYPYEALEEAVVNAAYHRSYEASSEPNKIYLYPDRVEIISYPGPVAGINIEHLNNKSVIPPVPARNRRIGEFLKELRLAEMRGTGIPKIRSAMEQIGSDQPTIDFDPDRTYFRVVLPAHPRYKALHGLRQASYLWSIGERYTAIQILQKLFQSDLTSGNVAAQYIDFVSELGDLTQAGNIFKQFTAQRLTTDTVWPYLRYFRALLSAGQEESARDVINLLPESEYANAPLEVAIAFKRLKEYERAHTIFVRYYGSVSHTAEYLHNFAQVKLGIALDIAHKKNPAWHTVRRLQGEATELLRRAIALYGDGSQKAWCYFDLARTLMWLREPNHQVENAYQSAIDILPGERAFREAFAKWKEKVYNRPSRRR